MTKMTKEETREMLREYGFVRVDGLRTGPEMVDEDTIVAKGQGGKWDYNNSICAVLTEHMELWIRSGGFNPSLQLVAPNGRGLWVPCSNGDWPSAYQLLARVANPDYMPEVLSPV